MSSARSTIERLRVRKRRRAAPPAPRPFTTRMPLTVSSTERGAPRPSAPAAARVRVVVAPRVRQAAIETSGSGISTTSASCQSTTSSTIATATTVSDVADRVADRVHHPRDVLRVGRGARHQLARPDAVVVARVEPQRVREDRVANARIRPAPGSGSRRGGATRARDDLEQPDAEQRQRARSAACAGRVGTTPWSIA